MALELSTASLMQIADHYAAPHTPWLRANMVVSSDRKFVGETGSSRDLTNSRDLELLLLLRAISDVVLVGANTARRESYRQPKLRAAFEFLGKPAPRLALASRSLDFDLGSPLFHGGDTKTIVLLAGNQIPSPELSQVADVIPVADVEEMISKLHGMGLPLITCEGGPELLAQLIAADLVDEYDLTMSPVASVLDSKPTGAEVDPEFWDLISEAAADDYKYLRYIRRKA